MNYLRIHKFYFLAIFSLKMGPTVLFTHLKIILLQCFKFSVFNFSKISFIQTDPRSIYIHTHNFFFFYFEWLDTHIHTYILVNYDAIEPMTLPSMPYLEGSD